MLSSIGVAAPMLKRDRAEYEPLYQAILASPYVHDMKAARQIMEELLVAHAGLMPQFE